MADSAALDVSVRTLLQLAPGERATIARVQASPELAPRLAALGFREGSLIELIRSAPFAGPLHLRLGTTDVIMRRQDAASILLA
jgi:ferrous iron transport protein A